MDAREYDRIADLLMQIRNKLAKQPLSQNQMVRRSQKEMLRYVSLLLVENDFLGKADEKGLV